MEKVVISLSVEELDVLKLLVKERIAIWQVRVDSADTDFAREHCMFHLDYVKALLKTLNNH